MSAASGAIPVGVPAFLPAPAGLLHFLPLLFLHLLHYLPAALQPSCASGFAGEAQPVQHGTLVPSMSAEARRQSGQYTARTAPSNPTGGSA